MPQTSLVQLFAAQLGWNGVRGDRYWIPEDLWGKYGDERRFWVWTSTDPKLFIQINQREHFVPGHYQVTIAPFRYRMLHTGFVDVDFLNEQDAISEAERVKDRLQRANYRDPRWRKQFLLRNPTRLFTTKRRGWQGKLRLVKLALHQQGVFHPKPVW